MLKALMVDGFWEKLGKEEGERGLGSIVEGTEIT